MTLRAAPSKTKAESKFANHDASPLPFQLTSKLVDRRGIEPRFSRCKREILPLKYRPVYALIRRNNANQFVSLLVIRLVRRRIAAAAPSN